MKTLAKFLMISLLMIFLSCKSDDGDMDIQDDLTSASGSIGGVAWEFDAGTAFFEEIDNLYTINLLGVAEGVSDDGCSILFPGEEYVRFTVSAAVGRTDIPFQFSAQGVKFYPDRSVGGFELATSGYVEITEISASQVKGVLDASLDLDNQVSGSFTVTICQ